jgi:hypothetical protein
MKTANLTGALLDFWTARAEGVPADQLEIRPVQRPDPRTPDAICVRYLMGDWGPTVAVSRYDPSTNWGRSGPLIEKHGIELENLVDPVRWAAAIWTDSRTNRYGYGDTPLIAICRAVVSAAFGDEVEDLPC